MAEQSAYKRFKMGDRFNLGGDVYFIVCTSDWKSDKIVHFQLVNKETGQRYSSKVVTHTVGLDDFDLLEFELVYLLELDIEVDAEIIKMYLDCHEKGPLWEDN